jgi:hypothetical protein
MLGFLHSKEKAFPVNVQLASKREFGKPTARLS